jgi:hypothetical protein
MVPHKATVGLFLAWVTAIAAVLPTRVSEV